MVLGTEGHGRWPDARWTWRVGRTDEGRMVKKSCLPLNKQCFWVPQGPARLRFWPTYLVV
eukprot:407333-Prymnesium_polylepis.1